MKRTSPNARALLIREEYPECTVQVNCGQIVVTLPSGGFLFVSKYRTLEENLTTVDQSL